MKKNVLKALFMGVLAFVSTGIVFGGGQKRPQDSMPQDSMPQDKKRKTSKSLKAKRSRLTLLDEAARNGDERALEEIKRISELQDELYKADYETRKLEDKITRLDALYGYGLTSIKDYLEDIESFLEGRGENVLAHGRTIDRLIAVEGMLKELKNRLRVETASQATKGKTNISLDELAELERKFTEVKSIFERIDPNVISMFDELWEAYSPCISNLNKLNEMFSELCPFSDSEDSE